MEVVIVNYNTCDLLRECVLSVERRPHGRITVVDAASNDGSLRMLETEFPAVHVVARRDKVGYGACANAAVRLTTTPYFLLLNADTQLASDAVSELAAYLDRHPRAAVVGPRLSNPDGSLQPSARRFPGSMAWLLDNHQFGGRLSALPSLSRFFLNAWPHDRARPAPWVVGAALAIRREAFDEVGGFDESYFMYFEEIDLCRRLEDGGWETHFAPVAEVVHVGRASTRQLPSQMQAEYISSALRFYRSRYHPARAFVLMGVMRLQLLWEAARDLSRLRSAGDEARRRQVREDLKIHAQLLLRVAGPPWRRARSTARGEAA